MADTQARGISLDNISEPEFGLIPTSMVPLVWPGIVELIRSKGAKWLEVISEKELFEGLCSGGGDLWCAMQNCELDGFVICQWEKHAYTNYYHVSYLAGREMRKYLPKALQQLERYACIMGAKELIMEGRPGLERVLVRYGYFKNTVKMRKNVRALWSN